jgi:hypothetical protein
MLSLNTGAEYTRESGAGKNWNLNETDMRARETVELLGTPGFQNPIRDGGGVSKQFHCFTLIAWILRGSTRPQAHILTLGQTHIQPKDTTVLWPSTRQGWATTTAHTAAVWRYFHVSGNRRCSRALRWPRRRDALVLLEMFEMLHPRVLYEEAPTSVE